MDLSDSSSWLRHRLIRSNCSRHSGMGRQLVSGPLESIVSAKHSKEITHVLEPAGMCTSVPCNSNVPGWTSLRRDCMSYSDRAPRRAAVRHSDSVLKVPSRREELPVRCQSPHALWADAAPTNAMSSTTTNGALRASCIIVWSSPKIRRRQRSSSTVQFFCTLSQRLVGPRVRASLVLRNEALVLRARAPASTAGSAEYGAGISINHAGEGHVCHRVCCGRRHLLPRRGRRGELPHGLLGFGLFLAACSRSASGCTDASTERTNGPRTSPRLPRDQG